MAAMDAKVVSVSLSAEHTFSKPAVDEISIEAGLGLAGDAHAGALVKHRYLVKKNPLAANLCQVHLLQSELFAELAAQGITVGPGEMGENVTTAGLDLPGLPLGTLLHLGPTAVVRLTGLRTPCTQMNGLRAGLMKACLGKGPRGEVVRKAGVMGVALVSGTLRAGEGIEVEWPVGDWVELGPV